MFFNLSFGVKNTASEVKMNEEEKVIKELKDLNEQFEALKIRIQAMISDLENGPRTPETEERIQSLKNML